MITETPILDGQRYGRLRALLRSEFPRLLERFRQDAARWIGTIEAEAAACDRAAIASAAHTLTGDALQFGAIALAQYADCIEKMARDAAHIRAFVEIATAVPALRTLLAHSLLQFDQEVAERDGLPMVA